MQNIQEVQKVELTPLQKLQKEQSEAKARAEALELEIAQAQQQEVEENKHKIETVLSNLKNQYGDLFETVISEKFQAETKVIVLSEGKEVEAYERFNTLIERGYKVVNGEVIGKRGEAINSNTINSQITNEPKVTMNVPKFKTLYALYK